MVREQTCSGHGWAGQGRPADGLGADRARLAQRAGWGSCSHSCVHSSECCWGEETVRGGALGPYHRPASRGIRAAPAGIRFMGLELAEVPWAAAGQQATSVSGLRGLSGLGKEGPECWRLCPSSVGLSGSGRAGLRCQLRLTPSSPSQPWRGEGANRKPQD